MKDGIVLTMRGICKRFPGVMALDRVDFTLRKGEIHALMGENGAGKSTLIKVLTGVYPKDAGEIHVDGIEEAISIRSPQEAQSYGISTVYQEISLCPNLTVAENMFIGRTEGKTVNWKAMEKRAGEPLVNVTVGFVFTDSPTTGMVARSGLVPSTREIFVRLSACAPMENAIRAKSKVNSFFIVD